MDTMNQQLRKQVLDKWEARANIVGYFPGAQSFNQSLWRAKNTGGIRGEDLDDMLKEAWAIARGIPRPVVKGKKP